MTKFIIASSKDQFFTNLKSKELDGPAFVRMRTKEELTVHAVSTIGPKYIFFPYWNWMVPAEIHERFECVCFHTAPLPYGRGGSPVQNLISRNIESAPVCALKMTDEIDGGPIYARADVSLLGGGDEIFMRISSAIEHLVLEIIRNQPVPVPQSGTPTVFKRRNPADSELPKAGSIQDIYNHIRMLDAEGYPLAFVEHKNTRISFRNATLRPDSVEASVVIKIVNPNDH